jgi:hypothetical protein
MRFEFTGTGSSPLNLLDVVVGARIGFGAFLLVFLGFRPAASAFVTPSSFAAADTRFSLLRRLAILLLWISNELPNSYCNTHSIASDQTGTSFATFIQFA